MSMATVNVRYMVDDVDATVVAQKQNLLLQRGRIVASTQQAAKQKNWVDDVAGQVEP